MGAFHIRHVPPCLLLSAIGMLGCTGRPDVGNSAQASAACPFGDGLYCGGDGVVGDPSTLYKCSGGNLTVSLICGNGCQVMPPGQNDQCAAGGSCPSGNGLYCGGNGVGGVTGTLYNCSAGNLSVAQVCPNGCQFMPPGTNDQCAGSPSCPAGDGLYCGGDGVPGDPSTLFHCSGGNLTPVQTCANGCQVMPPGTNDRCATAGCPFGNGLYCGGDGIGGVTGTLYSCSNGALSVAQVCANGCTFMPPGTNDACAGGGTCPSGDGLYCGGNGVPGDPSTLFFCSAGNLSVAQMCGNGCQRMPPGTNDACAGGGACPSGDGLYCGGNGVPGDPGTLFNCLGGNLTVAQNCTAGCQRMPPGTNDQCAGGGSCPFGDGLYCGGNGVPGEPGTLFLCSGGNLSVAQVCAAGCVPMPPGQNDRCGGGGSCPFGDGLYCGGNGVAGDPSTLFLCSGGNLSTVRICPDGCVPEAPGVDDHCRPPPISGCQDSDFQYCGTGDAIPGDPHTLYQCIGNNLTPVTTCVNGCQVLPPPHSDVCSAVVPGRILIQAGHENTGMNCRPTLVGATGAAGEVSWTPTIAQCIVSRLNAAGFQATHVDANFNCDSAALRVYDAVVSVHYQGHPPCDLRDPKTCIPRGGYFVGTVAQDLDPAFVASQRLAANISRDYGAITGIRRAFNWDTSSLNITHYHLKNNDTLTSPIFHGYKLSGPTPFAIIEAGVGDTGGFDHDVLWANQAGVCLSIALGIIDFLNGN